jgi:hypothetical protein
VGLRDTQIQAWLEPSRKIKGGFSHLRLTEKPSNRETGLSALAAAVAAAHTDAKRHLADVLGESLDPFDDQTVAGAYPAALHTLTLQGYLGEIFAAVIAENFEPHELDWEVPAFLFRFSNAAIEGLDRRLQLGSESRRTPGRTGDDCVAFLRADDGRIVAWLNCEAKCSSDHSAALIQDAAKQLSRHQLRPVSAYQLIEVLKDSSREDADLWISALRLFRTEAVGADPPPRADLLVYVCGRAPLLRTSWMAPETPHPDYTGRRPLEQSEIHLAELDDVLTTVYPGHVINRA